MSIERVRPYLRARGYEEKILEFDVSSATVELAAVAVGCAPARIAKTLAFKVNDRAIVIVAAGDAKVDNARFKATYHTKAKMLAHDETELLTGHAVGGVCPFALNEGVDVYLDESLRRFDIVYPAAGSSNSAIPLTMEELEQLSGGAWVDVCKAWRDEEKEQMP